jgi:hypothetical protein
MNTIKNGLSESEIKSENRNNQFKQKNYLTPFMIIFGAIAGYTSGHLDNITGILMFSFSIIAIGILLYLYYFRK